MPGLMQGMSNQPVPAMATGGYADYVPIRADPQDDSDGFDGRRIQLVRGRWMAQDAALLPYHRQVEENVRMIVGRHWDIWSPLLGQYVDVTRWMTDDERRWRQRPVVNRLLHWFILTHARLTENPPIVTFQPSTADELDAELAEVMDTIFKTVWHDCDMLEVIDRLMAILIPGGQAHLKSRVDFMAGDATHVATQQPDGTYLITEQKEGQITVDVLNPLECRGEWNAKPWHQKRWHIHRSFLTPQDVYERYNVLVPPDTYQATNSDGTGGYLTRLLFGSGYFGAAQAREYGANVQGMGNEAARKEGYVTVDEMWEAPSDVIPGYEETQSSAGGRLLTVTKERVLWDSNRPYAFRFTSPIRTFTFVNVPGRPTGSTPQEMMNPIQKTYNRGWAQILEHRNLTCNPILLIDNATGIQEGQITNKPGLHLRFNMKPGVSQPIMYLEPPPLSADVWKTQELLAETHDFLGNITGSVGEAPTDDPSGELVKQLRYNSDRFVGATVKRAVSEFVRLVQDWMVILPTLWTEDKMLTYEGDDGVARMVAIYPDLWEGNVRVVPDMDSMVPESRSQKVSRVVAYYQMGAFGPPGSPQAGNALLELTKFPQMNRLDTAGGVHRTTATQAMGKLARGATIDQIPLYPFYNFGVWQATFTQFMSGPDFLKLDENVQLQFQIMLQKIQGAQMAAQLQALKSAASMTAIQAKVIGSIAPPPGPGGPLGGPGGGGGGGGPPHGGGSEAAKDHGPTSPAAQISSAAVPAPANSPNVATQ